MKYSNNSHQYAHLQHSNNSKYRNSKDQLSEKEKGQIKIGNAKELISVRDLKKPTKIRHNAWAVK